MNEARHTAQSRDLSDGEIARQIPAARRRAARRRRDGFCAESVRYDTATRRIVLELTNGTLFGFPVSRIPQLRTLTASQLKGAVLSPAGTGIRWDAQDIDLSIPGLLTAAVPPSAVAREFGQRGGSIRSEAKSAAARANGAKGGRPRKVAVR